jgi:hypothetical protein
MMKMFQLQSKSEEQVFAVQIARHLAITINELKLRYITTLFPYIVVEIIFAKCCIIHGGTYNTSSN